jgi:O-succinylbenzoic acid--CoA ligase
MECSAQAVTRHLSATTSDVWRITLPLFHVGGYSILVRARLCGASVVPVNWDLSTFRSQLEANRVSLLSLVPTQVFDLVEQGVRAPESLRAVIIGGGRLEESLHDRATSLGWPLLQSYGMTECCSQIATATFEEGRVMRLLDHVEAREDAATGRLSIRSRALLSGRIVFDNHITAGARAEFEQPVDSDGWFETADRVEIIEKKTQNGALETVLIPKGRIGEVVKVLGELVDLAKVRSQLDAICEDSRAKGESEYDVLRGRSWLTAIEDGRRGHELALIVERPSETGSMDEAMRSSEILARLSIDLKERMAPYEKPTRIVWVDKIPRSSLGKVLLTPNPDWLKSSDR